MLDLLEAGHAAAVDKFALELALRADRGCGAKLVELVGSAMLVYGLPRFGNGRSTLLSVDNSLFAISSASNRRSVSRWVASASRARDLPHRDFAASRPTSVANTVTRIPDRVRVAQLRVLLAQPRRPQASSLINKSRRWPLCASTWRTHTRRASWWMARSRATCLLDPAGPTPAQAEPPLQQTSGASKS